MEIKIPDRRGFRVGVLDGISFWGKNRISLFDVRGVWVCTAGDGANDDSD